MIAMMKMRMMRMMMMTIMINMMMINKQGFHPRDVLISG